MAVVATWDAADASGIRNVFRYLRSGIGHGQWSNTILLVVAAWPALILLLGWLLFHRRS